MVGLNIPIKPRKGQLIISEPIGPFMEATVQCARYTWIKLKYRTNKRRYPNYRWHSWIFWIRQRKYIRRNWSNAKKSCGIFPAIKDLNFIRAFAGLRPFTPDGLPLIGEVDKIKGFYIAAGHEGDGIALAPISGKLLAELITDGKPSYNIDHFTPNRFEL